MSSTPSETLLRDSYIQASAKIEREFEATSNGRGATEERATLVDGLLRDLCREFLAPEPKRIEKMCLVAIGGYGRRALFPYSDIDLFFLFENEEAEKRFRDGSQAIARALWDLRLKASPTSRLLAECEKFHRDNAEFNISLLDTRFLVGDARLYGRLRNQVIPRMVSGGRKELLRDLNELTRQRHEKEGNTIFHLEPNLKNSPGGLRDFHVACWAAVLSRERNGKLIAPEEVWLPKVRLEMDQAFDFLAAARCFLHYRQGRDDNSLTYELQAQASARGIGVENGHSIDPADWMRIYFRHARTIYGLATQLLDESAPTRTSVFGRFENWRARRAHPDFFVVGGRLILHQPEILDDLGRVLGLFEFTGRQGFKLSRETEDQIKHVLPVLRDSALAPSELWDHLRRILIAPYAADALRAMHAAGLLVLLFPEFAAIDSLVMRDFYHHYTVDAHSIMAIEYTHRLRQPETTWEQPFAQIFSELEQPELLYLSLLFHDVGKGMPGDDHVAGSLEAVEKVFPRLGLKLEDADTVRFLIREHLAMSANLLRRDIFDPAVIRAFAEKVGTPELLKLLCLFTYADIRAVNPDALTPWKAESLWQLYVSTANYMSRSLDEERIHAEANDQRFVDRILPLVSEIASREQLGAFLEGLPRRYVLAHSPEDVATHFLMARQLADRPAQLHLEKRGHLYALTLLATDRPFLFAGISGTLAAWGMNIWKAEAFANSARIVVDTFHFADPHNTLELNPTEGARLQQNLADVLCGTVSIKTLMDGRATASPARPPKVNVATQIHFDDTSSSHSTLMEIVTQDRPGLLYRLSSALAHAGCNIEVALIDTEGQRALDAFYLTVGGAKLTPAHQESLRHALLAGS